MNTPFLRGMVAWSGFRTVILPSNLPRAWPVNPSIR